MTGLFTDILQWIYSWIGNYGWAVVVFTLLVRLVLLPLDIKSKKSMRAMSKVQPQMQALQKKYANDKDKLNQKMTELYRKEKVSPMAGCLPMLISLPILWFMFAAMRNLANEQTIQMILNMAADPTAEPVFEGWLWIKNVFQPDSFMATILPKFGDTLAQITAVKGSSILTAENIEAAKAFLATPEYAAIAAQYGAGEFIQMQLHLLIFNPVLTLPKSFAALFQHANGLFLLPLFAGASQFLMTKVTQPKQPKNADGEAPADPTGMNSGFMKWFFPLFSLFICASYNAAFAIYWMAANVIQIVQQVVVNWYFERKDKQEALMAEMENTK